jgi:hypothetical protein
MRARLILFLAAAALIGSGCSSNSDEVCQDIGDCSQHGDDDWITTCQSNANLLGTEADANGCRSAFDRYYSCADSNFSCQGATSTFPGCDDKLAALDSCIAAATANTRCAALQTAQAACTTVTPSAGPPPACTSLRDCQAACYLGAVANACAPQIDELQAVVACSDACPP